MECKGISQYDSIQAYMTTQVSVGILSVRSTPALSPTECKGHS